MIDESGSTVLLIVLDKVNETVSVLRQICQAWPNRMFIAGDGPHENLVGDVRRCEEVRAKVLEAIYWPCEGTTKFNAANQGCRLAVSSVISWFFEDVEQVIFLEDDYFPDESFFPFMQTMLDRYRDNPLIVHIGVVNCKNDIFRGRLFYYLPRYYHVWGWAPWRRVRKDYSLRMEPYPAFLADGALDRIFAQPGIAAFWKATFDAVHSGAMDTWFFQWLCLNIKREVLSIMPSVSFVHNIGFNESATHTKGADEFITSNVTKPLDTAALVHHTYVLANCRADLYMYTDYCVLNLSENKKSRLIKLAKEAV